MAFGASSTIETNQTFISAEEEYEVNDTPVDKEIVGGIFLSAQDQALPLARVKRIVQTISPVKVVKERTFSAMAQPMALEKTHKEQVRSYIRYSIYILLSLPPEEIAFPFTTFW